MSLTFAAAATALLVGGCATEKKTAEAPLSETINAQSFKRQWAAPLDLKDDPIERVFVKEDVVVAYTKKNQAYVLNKSGGAIRFSAKISDSRLPAHEPVILKERMVFPTDSTLEIYKRDGRFERSYKTTSSLRTNAVGAPNGSRIFFGVDSPLAGRVVCVETLPGQYKPVDQKWELMSNRAAPIDSAPAVMTGVAYVAFEDGAVYAVNQDTRASIWETSFGPTFQTYGPVTADLRVDDFGLYVPSTDTKFYCLDKTQGRQKWAYFAGAPLRETPQVTATMVYLPVRGRGIVAIDKLNGPPNREAKWVVKDAIKLVAEDEKYAYLQRSDNLITAVDKQTGEQRFTSRRSDLVAFATNTKDSTIYAAAKDGTVMAIVPVLKAGDVGQVAWLDLGDARPVDGAVAMR
jgi:outer membrane protein assembly factor BamB